MYSFLSDNNYISILNFLSLVGVLHKLKYLIIYDIINLRDLTKFDESSF